MPNKFFNLQAWRASLTNLFPPTGFANQGQSGQETTEASIVDIMSQAVKDAGRVALDRGLFELRKTPEGQFLERTATEQKINEVIQQFLPLMIIVGVVVTIFALFVRR